MHLLQFLPGLGFCCAHWQLLTVITNDHGLHCPHHRTTWYACVIIDTASHCLLWLRWRKLSSAALNELGEQEEERSKAFKPQHHITGQHLNFRSDTGEGQVMLTE